MWSFQLSFPSRLMDNNFSGFDMWHYIGKLTVSTRETHLNLGLQNFYWGLVTLTWLTTFMPKLYSLAPPDVKVMPQGPKLSWYITPLNSVTWPKSPHNRNCLLRKDIPRIPRDHFLGAKVKGKTSLWIRLIIYYTALFQYFRHLKHLYTAKYNNKLS